MDNDDENVENNKKYAFLLGSAIRSEDTDQFFSIYDKILPANIPKDRVESIKAEARRISELPDEEFDQLVLNARSYSLAKAKTMSRSSYPGVRLGKGGSDEDDEVQLRPYADKETTYSSLAQDSCILDMEQFERRTDNDSGFCNSSKATTSVGSNSEDSEEDDHRGCFDYVPSLHTRTGSSVKITPTYHLEYDEAHEVESDRASANDIDSPRSGKDSDNGIELRTFSRSKGNTDDDFETSDESDPEVTINKSRHSMYRNGRRSTNYYSPMKLESVDDFGDVSTSSFSFENSKRALQDRSGSSLREINVDDPVSFPIYSRHRPQSGATYGGVNYGSTSGENVRIEKSSFNRSRDCELMGDLGPPFGSDYDHLNKVGSSIESLISGTKQTVEGMPEGRPISQTLDLADSRQKSKRKKKASKDDSEDRLKPKRYSDNVDENGNPALTESSPLLGSSSSYYHMREHQPVRHIARKNDTHSNFPSRPEQFNSFQINGQTVRELEDTSSNSSEKVRKKKPKKEKGVERRAEDVENYVGNKELDELLSFIESDGTRNSKNSRKIPCGDSQSEKNKKNKEKRHRTIQDKVEGKVNDKKDKNDELVIKNCVTSLTPDSVTDKSEVGYHNNMGNSTAKIEEIDADHSIMDGGLGKEEKIDKMSDLQKESDEDNTYTVVKEVLSNNSKKENEVINNEENRENEIRKVIANVEDVKKEISLPNGVKRNNVKNSKKKTVSKGKEEASSNGPKPVSNSVGLTNPMDFDASSIYIFTDIDSLKPVEEEFKVVGKKKKKGASQVKEHIPKDIVPIVKQFQKDDRVPRSITPPPRSTERVIEHSPDLSLSSFPELANPRQGRQHVREGRRNSTGDVPKEINLKAHDDSDIESVKSLPAASQALSPRLPMSYAKMAASPAPGGSSQASLSTDTEGVVVSEKEKGSELKSAVWKGSITERRHSIGSSPDGKESESQATKQKFGSQEALTKITDQEDAVIVQSNVKSDSVPQSDTKEESEKVSFPTQELPASQSQHQLENANESSQFDNSMSETNLKLSSSMHSLPPDPKVITSNSVYISPKTSKTSLAKTTNHKKSIKSNQSVVFLDKRVKIPQNLDITFGFLDSEDRNDPALEVETQNLTSDIHPTYNSHNLPSVSLGSDSVTDNNISSTMTGDKLPVNKHSPHPCSSSNKLINSDFNTCDTASKAICELENRNGIINHRQKHQNVQCKPPATASFSFINDPEEISVCDAAKISASDEASIASGDGNLTDNEKLYKSRKNSILVHFGDCLRCVGENNVGHIEFVPEKEFVHQYNREDVIGFLQRAWENVQNLKKQGVSTVTTYQGE